MAQLGALAATAERKIAARNASASSANKIHSDEGARALGYRGALVTGNALYCYLSGAILGAYGPGWLGHGGAFVRFRAPVYDGDELTAAARPDAARADAVALALVRDADTTLAAHGVAWLLPDGEQAPPADRYPLRPLPAAAVPFSEAVVLDQDELGSLDVTIEPADIAGYLAAIGEDEELYRGTTPSAFLARMYAPLMSANVIRSQPSIHVSSDLRHYRAVEPGERLSVRGRIDRLYGRRGNRHYVLDMAWVDEAGAVVMTSVHTAIYRIRPRTAS